MSTDNPTQGGTLNQNAIARSDEVDIMTMTWCQAEAEYAAAHDIGDAARAALLKLIRDRNADLLETVTSENMYPRSTKELKVLEARCTADWQRFRSGVWSHIHYLPLGGAGPFCRLVAAAAIVNKPFSLALTPILLPSDEWAELSALSSWPHPEVDSGGFVVGLRKDEETLVRYFYAYSGREQPDLSSLRKKELDEVLRDVRNIVEREWALDKANLVNRGADGHLTLGSSINIYGCHFRQIQELRRPWFSRISERALRVVAALLLLPERPAWHVIDALRNRGKSQAD